MRNRYKVRASRVSESPRLSRRAMMQLASISVAALTRPSLLAAAAPIKRKGGGTNQAGSRRTFTIDLSRLAGQITPLLFGHNLEHTRRAVWRGLSAQMLANRKFAGASTTDRRAATADKGFY